MGKFISKILLGLVLITGVAAAGLYIFLRASLPQVDGAITVAGLENEIEIIRDENAVPHIYAQSDDDAFYALGFLHAQDRLWQLEINRRIAAGRLSEILGAGALDTDKFLRTLGVYRAAQKAYDNLDEDSQSMLQAYSAGINGFLDQSPSLPPEFLLTGADMTPWNPVDSMAWLKMMAWDLGGNWRDELARLELIARLGPKRAEEFQPPYPGNAPFNFPELSDLYPGLSFNVKKGTDTAENLFAPLQARERKWIGSNNWVMDGSWTKSGKPLLANDPHLGLTTPSIWYLAHININGQNIIGSTLPAVPFVVLGRNDRIAWGFTNTGPDVQDLYIERLTADGLSYETENGPQAFDSREEVIKVKDGADVTLTVRTSRHGPIMSDVSGDMQRVLDKRHVMAFRWTALEDTDTSASAGRQMTSVHDWTGMREALRAFHAPEQNIVFADVDGNIGYIAPGKVPVRSADSPTQGLLPARGWLGTDQWVGRIAFDELPQTYNPPSGMVHTANQKIVSDDYPHHITDDWALPYRADRIAAELQKSTQHDVASFIDIQMDPASNMAIDMRDVMLSIGDFRGAHEAIRDALGKWNGGMTRDRPEPLIYMAWHRAVSKHIYADDFGDRFERYWSTRPDFLLPLFHGAPQAAHWCDDQNSMPVETCSTQVARALDDAISELSASYGDDWTTWRWGDAHIVRHAHRPFSNVDILKSWFELSDEADGGPYAINVSATNFSSQTPYESTAGPSYRAIYDLANLDASRYIIPGGQSGHPLSPHYGDLAPLWRDGEFIEISTAKDAIKQGAIGTLVLKTER